MGDLTLTHCSVNGCLLCLEL